MEKIKSFTDLHAWKQGHLLVIEVYKLTNEFPQKEMYSLANQMQRCAISITSNIAEGFSRSTKKDKNNFYHISLGSLTELQNQLLVSRDIGYLDKINFKQLADQTVRVSKLINGLIKSSKNA